MTDTKQELQPNEYLLPTGEVIELLPVAGLVIQLLTNSNTGKPRKPKMPHVEIGKSKSGKVRTEPNPDDPDYQQALKEYEEKLSDLETEKTMKMFRYLVEYGVANETPDDFIDSHEFYINDMSEKEIKYFWIVEALGNDQDEMGKFTEAIIGITEPTEAGVAESTEKFHANGQPSPKGD